MFERKTSYLATYVGAFPAFAQEWMPTALRWARGTCSEFGEPLTVVAPSRTSYGDIGPLAELPRGLAQETFKTIGSTGRVSPVVILCWPDSATLGRVDSARNLKALCVLPWIEEDLAAWRQARQATDLLGLAAVPPPATISDPVVLKAMRSVTEMANLANGLDSRNRGMAVWAFKILHRGGHRWDRREIEAWAMANGWRAGLAAKLAELGDGVAAGRTFRVGARPWNARILDIWREDSAAG